MKLQKTSDTLPARALLDKELLSIMNQLSEVIGISYKQLVDEFALYFLR